MNRRRARLLRLSNSGIPGRSSLVAYFRNGVDTIGESIKTKPAHTAPAPTYFVKPATGSNGNDGLTAETAFRDIDFAANIVQPGETVQIIASANAPARNGLNVITAGTAGNPITWRGQSDDERAYLAGGANISQGAATPDCLFGGGDMEGWVNASTPWVWTSTALSGNIIAAETSIKHSGAKSAKFIRVTSAAAIERYVHLSPNTQHTLRGWHYETATGKYFTIKIQNATTSEYLQTDLVTWGELVGLNQSTSLNAWSEFVIPFTTQAATLYKIRIELAVSGTSYLDDVTLTDDSGVCSWAVHSGDALKLPKLPRATNVLTKCSNTDWSTSGMNALEKIPKAESLVDCVVTENSWWWESSILYYHPPAGESIADVHLETGGYSITGDRTEIIYCTKAYSSFAFLDVVNANGHSVALNAANLLVDYCRAYLSKGYGFSCIGAANSCVINDSISEYSQIAAADGFVTSGVMETNRCISRYNYDEGFESFTGGTLIARFCVSHHNGNSDNIDVEGFSCSSDAGSGMELYNCVSAYNAGHGISIVNTTGKFRAYNNISINNAVHDPTAFDVNASTGQVDFVADYNCHLTRRAFWTAQAGSNEITTDPLSIDPENGNFHLSANSPCIGAGTTTALTGTANLYDADGVKIYDGTLQIPDGPFIDGPDVGAIAHQVGDKYYLRFTVVSGTGPTDWVVKAPAAPDLINIIGVGNTLYNASGVPLEIAWSVLMAFEGPVYFGAEERNGFAVYDPEPTGTLLVRVNRYFKVTA